MSFPADLQADLELALAAARTAGELVLRSFRRDHAVRYKTPEQPVTEADLAADALLREMLTRPRPHYGWLSEETVDSRQRLAAERVWIVDPIDGTNSFIAGRPEFAISIALATGGQPRLAVVYNPAREELYHATRGGGAFRNRQPIRVSRGGNAGQGGLILASRSELRRGEFASLAARWRIRTLGSTAYKMVRIAEGDGDAYLSRHLKSEWDVAAAALVVLEAGGAVTDLDGGELRFNRSDPMIRGILATNGLLHATLQAEAAALPFPAHLR